MILGAMSKQEGILGNKGQTRRRELDKEALYFPKQPTIGNIA